jgi:hypothetical protein
VAIAYVHFAAIAPYALRTVAGTTIKCGMLSCWRVELARAHGFYQTVRRALTTRRCCAQEIAAAGWPQPSRDLWGAPCAVRVLFPSQPGRVANAETDPVLYATDDWQWHEVPAGGGVEPAFWQAAAAAGVLKGL